MQEHELATKTMQQAPSMTSASETQRQVSPMISDLFSKFRVMYGGKFERLFQSCSSETTQRRISMALMEWDEKLAKIPPALVAYGLRRLSTEIESAKQQGKESWPPVADQFAVLCKPRPLDLGMPSVDHAYTAAKMRNWNLHPAVKAAGSRISAEDWAKGDWHCVPVFRAEYKHMVELIASGEPMPIVSGDNLLKLAHERPEDTKDRFDLMRKALSGSKV